MSNAILNHTMGLTRYRALRYCARLPSHHAESGSLSLCTAQLLLLPSDPAVASNAIVIQIVFPLVGVTPAYRRLGLSAMPGKQKRGDKGPPRPSPAFGNKQTKQSWEIEIECERAYQKFGKLQIELDRLKLN